MTTRCATKWLRLLWPHLQIRFMSQCKRRGVSMCTKYCAGLRILSSFEKGLSQISIWLTITYRDQGVQGFQECQKVIKNVRIPRICIAMLTWSQKLLCIIQKNRKIHSYQYYGNLGFVSIVIWNIKLLNHYKVGLADYGHPFSKITNILANWADWPNKAGYSKIEWLPRFLSDAAPQLRTLHCKSTLHTKAWQL